jgi:hypothetical protein
MMLVLYILGAHPELVEGLKRFVLYFKRFNFCIFFQFPVLISFYIMALNPSTSSG